MFKAMTTPILSGLLLCLLATSAMAEFYVIPGGAGKATVVTVAASGGDYTSPIDAMNAITDASADKPYIIKVEAGTYQLVAEQLVMKEYVDIVGAGKDTTTIVSLIGSPYALNFPNNYRDSATLVGADNTRVEDITIQNYCGSTHNGVAAFTGAVEMTFRNVNFVNDRGVTLVGLFTSNSIITLIDCSISITQATGFADGLKLEDVEDAQNDDHSTVFATNLVVSVTSTKQSRGIHIRDGSRYLATGGSVTVNSVETCDGYLVKDGYLSIMNQTISAENTGAGFQANGIYLIDNYPSYMTAQHATINATGMNGSYSVVAGTGCYAALNSCDLTGGANSASGTRIAITNSDISSAAGAVCAECTRDNGATDVGSNCGPL